MVDEMIHTVKAALTTGADDVQQVVAILRGLSGMLDSGVAGRAI